MYSVLFVAAHIIKHCNEDQMPVSNLKLQKLLYFVQAEFLVNANGACFPEEIEAWDFGPVVPVVYHKYKIYGSSSILYTEPGAIDRITREDQKRIDNIVDECAQYTAAQLVEITHHQTPWLSVYVPYKSNVISKKSIKDFFTEG